MIKLVATNKTVFKSQSDLKTVNKYYKLVNKQKSCYKNIFNPFQCFQIKKLPVLFADLEFLTSIAKLFSDSGKKVYVLNFVYLIKICSEFSKIKIFKVLINLLLFR